MPQFTKQLAQFLEDAVAAGFVLKLREPLEQSETLPVPRSQVILSRSGIQDCAKLYLVFRNGKWRFGKAEPPSGAERLEDFWTMKGVRQRLNIGASSIDEE